jgi:hypothetical protein
MIRKKYYIAGPMRGCAKLNFPLFDRVAALVETLGFEAVNPADIDREYGITDDNLPESAEESHAFADSIDTKEVAKRDLLAVLECDGIVLLPDWENSNGAKAEKALADWLGLEIFYFDEEKELFVPEKTNIYTI